MLAVVFFLLLQVVVATLFLYLTLAFVSGAPFVPSTKSAAAAMIRLAALKPKMKVYDLGSGDGRLLLLAASQGALAVGLEINPYLVLLSKLQAVFSPSRKRINVRWQNFWHADISDADAVFIYLLPWRMKQFEEYLRKQLKPGTLVVSNSFIFPDWPVYRQDRENHIYVFKVS